MTNRYGHASVAIGDKVYLWGGRNDIEGACNNLYCFSSGNCLEMLFAYITWKEACSKK